MSRNKCSFPAAGTVQQLDIQLWDCRKLNTHRESISEHTHLVLTFYDVWFMSCTSLKININHFLLELFRFNVYIWCFDNPSAVRMSCVLGRCWLKADSSDKCAIGYLTSARTNCCSVCVFDLECAACCILYFSELTLSHNLPAKGSLILVAAFLPAFILMSNRN